VIQEISTTLPQTTYLFGERQPEEFMVGKAPGWNIRDDMNLLTPAILFGILGLGLIGGAFIPNLQRYLNLVLIGIGVFVLGIAYLFIYFVQSRRKFLTKGIIVPGKVLDSEVRHHSGQRSSWYELSVRYEFQPLNSQRKETDNYTKVVPLYKGEPRPLMAGTNVAVVYLNPYVSTLL
jgi:hypothetical protein